LGDAQTVVTQLVEATDAGKRPDWRAEANGYVQATLVRQQALMDDKSSPIRTEHLCDQVSRALPDNALLVADTGYSAIWSATMIRMKPSQRYIRAAGSLGWSYPASMGAKCGVPDRPVVCFIGDGGFFYHLPEMETAVRYGINTVTVINNNGLLSQCAPSIKSMYPDRQAEAVKMITFHPVNFTRVAEEFGLHAVRVEKAEDIAPAIQNALTCGKPAIVEVMTANTDDSHPLPAVE